MASRFVLFLLGGFCLCMTVLLYRMEYHRAGALGGPFPAAAVWEKILEAPDNSDMVVRRNDQKIGYFRWLPNLSESAKTARKAPDEFQPEGMLAETSIYTIDLDGNFVLAKDDMRYRFTLNLEFDAQKNWRTLFFRFIARPSSWEVEANADERQATIRYRLEDAHWDHTFTFEELQNPAQLFSQFGQEGILLDLLKQSLGPIQELDSAPSMQWIAHHDRIRLGRSYMRAYRVEGRFMDRYSMTLFVSRVGEILKVELPGNIRLINEAISH